MNTKTAILLLMILIGSGSVLSGQINYDRIASWTFYNALNNGYSIKRITLSTGVELEFVEQGDVSGTPVIFLHGFTDSWHSFESGLRYLPAGIHAFAITQRGHGNSSKPDGGYRPADFAKDIAAFIQKQKLGPVYLVGHSLGGVITQQFALDHPELLRGIVLVGTDATFSDNPGMPEFHREILKLTDPLSYEFADAFQKETIAEPIDEHYYKLLVSESLKVPSRVWKSTADGFMNVNYAKDLGKIKHPTLIVWGSNDKFISRSDQDQLTGGIPHSRLLVYEGTGHALHWEQPRKFATDLLNFIQPGTVKR